jgi:4-hydroxy-4-methyl-2-oxoglutarate aldolase
LTAANPARKVVVEGCPGAEIDVRGVLAESGIATVHQADGRSGHLGTIRPAWPRFRVGGTSVTALSLYGDNRMADAGAESCRRSDILVVTTTSPSTEGAFGEVLASPAPQAADTPLTTRGVRAVVERQATGFGKSTAAVSAQGTVIATVGAFNMPVSMGGQPFSPAESAMVDDDGVAVVPRPAITGAGVTVRAWPAREKDTRARQESAVFALDAMVCGLGWPGMAWTTSTTRPTSAIRRGYEH